MSTNQWDDQKLNQLAELTAQTRAIADSNARAIVANSQETAELKEVVRALTNHSERMTTTFMNLMDTMAEIAQRQEQHKAENDQRHAESNQRQEQHKAENDQRHAEYVQRQAESDQRFYTLLEEIRFINRRFRQESE
jgi:hypothetical protein